MVIFIATLLTFQLLQRLVQHRRRMLVVMVVMCAEIRRAVVQMAQPAVDSRTHQAGQCRTDADSPAGNGIVQRPVVIVTVVVVVQMVIRGPIGITSSTSSATTRSTTTAAASSSAIAYQILQAQPAGVGHRVKPGAGSTTSSRSASTFHHGLWI